MSLGWSGLPTLYCNHLRWNLHMEVVIQTVLHKMRSDFVIAHFDAKAVKVPWVEESAMPNDVFNGFGHLVIIAETLWGCCHTPSSAQYQRWHPLDHPHTRYMPKTTCSRIKASSSSNDEHRLLAVAAKGASRCGVDTLKFKKFFHNKWYKLYAVAEFAE